ncbi:MAG: type III-B CRISPR-associated protein Cas10/Cmr2 [Gammaproteobacteria bacterium]
MTDKPSKLLHFNFTPVQSFVAQARRTRDLWAGSYLLSWLAGHAMSAIIEDGGEILMPSVEGDALMAAIKKPEAAPQLAKSLGTLPNRFTACIPDDRDPNVYVLVIQAKWQQVADVVYNRINTGKTPVDKDFWDRQIKHHWEFAWVIGDDSSLLDTRKNLRVLKPIQESGEKCTVCGERQELSESGESPPFKPNRKRSRHWWSALQESDLDLRENERLCAVCLTKRLFPLVAEVAISWPVERYYPSTAYLAAIDWLDKVVDAAKQPKSAKATQIAANELVAVAKGLRVYNAECNTKIKSLIENIRDSGIDENLIKLDGDVFYLSGIAADQLQKRGSNARLSTEEKQQLSKALKKLHDAVDSEATPFYALLLMDGDGMGKLLAGRSADERKAISKALAGFTGQVPDIVYQHNGKLVYAGGDDVFALLPASTAINCAAQCRNAYRQAFTFTDLTDEIKTAATISAAVQFAHQNIALNVVVQDAHRLLDGVAKDRTGRDALACRVWKPGGAVLTWSQPWISEQQTDFAELLQAVADDFHPQKNQDDRFSSKFLHKLRDLFELVESGEHINAKQIEDLLVAEYLANREHNWLDNDKEQQRRQAQERVARLLALCRQQTRLSENGQISYRTGCYQADAALLVRFLVQKEV